MTAAKFVVISVLGVIFFVLAGLWTIADGIKANMARTAPTALSATSQPSQGNNTTSLK